MTAQENSLITKFPDLAHEWHSTKNGDLTPTNVSYASGKKVWWACLNDPEHEWETRVYDRTRSLPTKCPYCSNKKISTEKSLLKTHPHLSLEWHATKNEGLTPETVTHGSEKKVWWVCTQNPTHEWTAAICQRTRKRSTGCPFCSNKKVSTENSLLMTHPHLALEWHMIKNKGISPSNVTVKSSKKVYWQCIIFPEHIWRTSIRSRVLNKSRCQICYSKWSPVINKKGIEHSLFIQNPDLVQNWHPTRNGFLTPYDVCKSSTQLIWWTCENGLEHDYLATLSDAKKGCPTCHNFQILYPEIVKEWHIIRNYPLQREKILINWPKKIWWQCSINHKHIWLETIQNRIKNDGCPTCFKRIKKKTPLNKM